MASAWTLEPGWVTTRAEIAKLAGGSVYSGGIVPSRTSPNIMLFSDPSEGEKYGYDHDGIDAAGRFNYTGAGSSGDHKLDGANGSVLNHEKSGRSLQLFVAVGLHGDTQTKLQQYVGQFRIDPTDPSRFEPSVGKDGKTRAALVLHLLPVGPNALPTLLTAGEVQLLATTAPTAVLVAPEVNSTFFYETKGSPAATSEKRENQLVEDYTHSFNSDADRFARWAIRVPGEPGVLLTDIYDRVTQTLYEAKGTSGRGIVRLAVGQLLDYRRHIEVENLRTAVLLPSAPTSDVGQLILSAGNSLVFREPTGAFHTLAS